MKSLRYNEQLTDNGADSAPGSDGIPYGVYKKLWTTAGPVI